MAALDFLLAGLIEEFQAEEPLLLSAVDKWQLITESAFVTGANLEKVFHNYMHIAEKLNVCS